MQGAGRERGRFSVGIGVGLTVRWGHPRGPAGDKGTRGTRGVEVTPGPALVPCLISGVLEPRVIKLVIFLNDLLIMSFSSILMFLIVCLIYCRFGLSVC